MPLSRINSASIANSAISAADIADGTITAAKIISVANTQITGTLSVANTSITGNIISSQIAPSVTLTTPLISGNLNFDANGTSGIRVPSANTLTFHTAGTEDVRIDATGNVGIGTTSPANLLHVEKSYSGTIVKIKNNAGAASSDAGLEVETSTTGAKTLLLKNSGTEIFSLLGSGELKFNSGYGSSVTAYGCRAWVNFNGTGTPAIRGSGNVSSIGDVATGRYNINFATAMPDVNYAVNATGDHLPNYYFSAGATTRTDAFTTSYFEANFFNNSLSFQDPTIACVTVFR